jgi:NAD-dependent dihydropyrimidine dehydrogenase PreA subunit
MTYVIGEPCVDVLDRACVEECPVDCIYEGERMLYIHPLGSPGGAAKLGVVGADTPLVATLPPREQPA